MQKIFKLPPIVYLRSIKNTLTKKNKNLKIKDYLNFIRFYSKWKYSIQNKDGNTPLESGKPWITFAAIEFLEKTLSDNDRVFEYGTGGSTIFFAKRAKRVISVEHDIEWYNNVVTKLNEEGLNNVVINCIQGENLTSDSLIEPTSYNSCYSEQGLTFSKYVHSINDYPDNYFDLVLVDGRARPPCIKQACSKVKPGKYILLDNSDRDRYQLAIRELLLGWKRVTYEGPTLCLPWFTQTSVWQKKV
ncbi:MAG: hypothetical protein BRC50_05380 [Cyanobacteria bacterium SW_11_48_12]|nr:MAG: hypothetical protein BRC50_05380 [Cyanobacteria bacterium SW_11_48_12]